MHERVHKNGLEKPYSWYLVISQAFYKEWVEISMESTTNASFTGLSTIEQWNMCLKNMTAGMVPWYGLTVPWLKAGEGLINVFMHALHKSNHHRGSSMLSRGKSPRLKGNPNFRPSLSFGFSQWSTYHLKWNVFKFDSFPNSFTIFRGLCAFSRH